MKRKITNKEVRANFAYRVIIPYCGLQNLLFYQSPVAYNSNVYGWAYDVYSVYGKGKDGYIGEHLAIITGYNWPDNLGRKITNYQKFEEKARKIRNDNTIEYKEKVKRINRLLERFVDNTIKAINENN